MTGDEIKQIRTDLAMEPAQFAELLGVSLASLYRWESLRGVEVGINPLQLQLLTVLQQRVARESAQRRAEIQRAITTGLLIGGGLLGLYALLHATVGDTMAPKTRARTTPRARRSGGRKGGA